MKYMMKKFCMFCLFAGVSIFPFAGAMAQQNQTILKDNVVDLRKLSSPKGFVHPGVPFSREDLETLKANIKREPWKSG